MGFREGIEKMACFFLVTVLLPAVAAFSSY